MRALASFMAVVASVVTIGATVVRLWWSKPKRTPYGEPDEPPRAPRWLRRLAAAWLWVLFVGGGALLFVIVILTLIDLSA